MRKVFFALKVVLGLSLATAMWPGVQMIWVFALTGTEGLTPNNYATGDTLPFYGWYLIFTRWFEFGSIYQ